MTDNLKNGWKNYVIGLLTSALLLAIPACYTQVQSQVRELEVSDRSQDVKLGKIETGLENINRRLEEIRDELRRNP